MAAAWPAEAALLGEGRQTAWEGGHRGAGPGGYSPGRAAGGPAWRSSSLAPRPAGPEGCSLVESDFVLAFGERFSYMVLADLSRRLWWPFVEEELLETAACSGWGHRGPP